MSGDQSSATRNAELEAFASVRQKPAVFLFVQDSLRINHVLQMRRALGEQEFDELDLVIHSGGGDIHIAYQIIELLRLHAAKIHACVPFFAKSAATLLCLGANDIVVDKLAQLGPLDAQIYEEEKPGTGHFTSALNPFKTLEQLQRFSLETLDIAMNMIVARSGMSIDECLERAIRFVEATTGPLFTQLDPAKLGEYSRALAVGTEYGERLLRRHSGWDGSKCDKVLEKLVHGYPSHEYIIDFHELQELGFDASLFTEDESRVVQGLYSRISDEEPTIELILPADISEPLDESAKEKDAE